MNTHKLTKQINRLLSDERWNCVQCRTGQNTICNCVQWQSK